MSNWQQDHDYSMSSEVGPNVSLNTAPENDPEPYPYCGPKKAWPKPRWVALYQLLIYPLLAIMEPLLLNSGHQCIRKTGQSHLLLGSARLDDGHQRLLILRELVSPPCCTLTECHHTRTKGP